MKLSRDIKFTGVSLPDSVIAGEYFIMTVAVEALDVLFDSNNMVMVDSNDSVLLPSDGEHTSTYSGEEIDEFIKEVLS